MKREDFPKKYQKYIKEVESYKICLPPCCVKGNEYIVHVNDGKTIAGINSKEVIREVKAYINSLS